MQINSITGISMLAKFLLLSTNKDKYNIHAHNDIQSLETKQ